MTHELRDNYAIMAQQARQLFLTYDQVKLCRRLGLPYTEEEIPIRFLDRTLHLRRRDGQVCTETGDAADFNTVMSVYDLLCHSQEAPTLAGTFVPTTALHRIQGTHSVHENFYGREAAWFDAHQAALRRACEAMGGNPAAPGDLCYTLPVFDCFPCCLRFWAADEEFPASLQFLWDAKATDFVHYETLFYIAGALLQRLYARVEADLKASPV